MTTTFPHGYALLVGVGTCKVPSWSLPTTAKDARALEQVLLDKTRCGYLKENVKVLYDESATRQGILDGLAWLARKANADPNATAILYLSGHGWLHSETNDYYFVPSDIEPYNEAETALPVSELRKFLGEIQASRLLFFVDSCYAEGASKGKGGGPRRPPNFEEQAMPKTIVDELAAGEGRAIFTSSSGEEESWVRRQRDLSVFTFHLLEGLQGAANKENDEQVRVSHLMSHLGATVSEGAEAAGGAKQTPHFKFETEDFPVAVLFGGNGQPKEGQAEAKEQAREAIARYVANNSGSGAIAQDGGVAAGEGGVAAKKIRGGVNIKNRFGKE